MDNKNKINIKYLIITFVVFIVGIIFGYMISNITNNVDNDTKNVNNVLDLNREINESTTVLSNDNTETNDEKEEGDEEVEQNEIDEFIRDYSIYLANAKVGSSIIFGQYEQDNNIYNGKEDIEWIVLYKSNKNSMLLISKYILDCMPYNYTDKDVTWNDSDLRHYLNDVFYNDAFNDVYKKFLMENEMANNDNINYKTDAGIETVDKVFLLSESQAKKYFAKDKKNGDNESRVAYPTEFAKNKGILQIIDKNLWYDNTSSYFLRTPGVSQDRVETIDKNGSIYQYGEKVTNNEIGIRPCIWLKYVN